MHRNPKGIATFMTVMTVVMAANLSWVYAASATPPAPAGISWEDPVTLAEGAGVRGPWRMNDSDFQYVDDPTVAMNAAGWIAVAWADQAEQDLFFQLYDPQGEAVHESPVRLSRSPGTFSWLPRLVLDDRDPPSIHALWQEIVFSGVSHGGEIFHARSRDGGESFSEPANLSRTEAGAGKGRTSRNAWQNGSLDLIRDEQGHLHVAWTEYEGPLRYARSTDDGESFSDPVHVAGDQQSPARGPALADRGEGVLLAWAEGEDPEGTLRFAHLQEEQATAPATAVSSEGHLDAPGLATDTQGRTHLVFAAAPTGPAGSREIRHAELGPEDEAFSPTQTVSAPAPHKTFDRAHYPEIALDGRDRAVILWELFPEDWQRPLALGLSYREDRQAAFNEPIEVPGTGDPEAGIQGSLQGLFMRKLAVNESGRIAVVNATFRPHEASRVTLLRGRFETD